MLNKGVQKKSLCELISIHDVLLQANKKLVKFPRDPLRSFAPGLRKLVTPLL